MKPVKLQFKGINSFSEQTEIDFERLTKSGIFGIFGDTGSGKSTILDCINFALYGKVERSKEKLDIINYRSEAAEVKFEFDVLCEGKRKRYTVERSLKKKSGLHKALLYEDEKCVADNATTVTKKITDVLGVDAEDFRKCIALPQGEFSQFVKSQPAERIALIERLFSLSKYGDRLKERLKIRENQAELAFQTASAKLGLYNDVSSEIIKEYENQAESVKKQIDELTKKCVDAEKEYSELKSLSEKSEELRAVIVKLEEMQSLKPRMEDLRKGLKSVPVCKAAVETECEISEKTAMLADTEKAAYRIMRQTESVKDESERLKKLTESENFDERIARCITLSAKYLSCEGKPEKLSLLEKGLERKRGEYKEKDALLEKLKKNLSAAEAEVKEIEKKLTEINTNDLQTLINVYFKGAVLKDEYVDSLDYFVGLNGQLKFLKDDSDLYKFMSAELKQRIEIYRDKVYQVKDFSFADAQKRLENVQATTEAKERLTAELNEKTVALKDAQSAVNDCLREIKIIQRDGEELRKQTDEIKAELVKVFGNLKDYSAAERENSLTLERLKKQKDKLSADIEKSTSRLSELSAEYAAKQSEIKAVKADIVKLTEKLKSLIGQSGFDDIVSCKKLTEEYEKYPDAEKALNEYDLKLISLSARRGELEKIKEIKSYTKEALSAAEEKKKAVSSELSLEREKLAVLQSDIKKAAIRLEEKKELVKELSVTEKQRNLIAQLKDLTKGNKFMEFIANEYLYDISALASSTLLNLTDGRYFLTYTDTFYAGDNFNCGNLRGVNTLSGGETFLVSLSLALALSQTICASLKSIEFFFLDEGFGTLDSTLVDTVLNALEKLKSSHFTIGVISHVEELKHRIDNKITVNKATESHGSTVQISC